MQALATTPKQQERLQLIKGLSDDFTSDDDLALKMDGLLADELRAAAQPASQSSAVEPAKPATPAKRSKAAAQAKQPSVSSPSARSLIEMRDLLLDVIDNINMEAGGAIARSNGSGIMGPVQYKDLSHELQTSLVRRPVNISDLDKDLQQRLTSTSVVTYNINGQLTPPTKGSIVPVFQKCIDDLILGQPVYLVGKAGTGKTYMAEELGKALGRPTITVNCNQWTAPGEIIGGQSMDGYVEGKLIIAWQTGAILILDELPKIDPNTAGVLNDALAKVKLPDAEIYNARKEKFVKHPGFGVVATGNIWPIAESITYGANNKQDLSLLDRFVGSVYEIDKNEQLEQSVVGSLKLWQLCAELRRCVEELKYEQQVSLRFMLVARDSLILELQRLQSNKGLADQGKTLADVFISFIKVNFTQVQQDALVAKFNGTGSFTREKIDYISTKLYRHDAAQFIREFTDAGYWGKLTVDGLGSTSSAMRRFANLD